MGENARITVGRSYNSWQFTSGNYQSIRIYNRTLTEQEICDNAWADYGRFGGANAPACGPAPAVALPTVEIGGQACTDVQVISDTKLTCVPPESNLTTPNREGSVDVVVTLDGTTDTITKGYTYRAPIIATGILPSSGSTTGGTEITINGRGFKPEPTYASKGLVLRYDGIDNDGT
jgi:hypothetical protein